MSSVYCARERVPRDESEYDLIYVSDYDVGHTQIARKKVDRTGLDVSEKGLFTLIL